MAHSEEHGLHLTRRILATATTQDSTTHDITPWVEPPGDPAELRGRHRSWRST